MFSIGLAAASLFILLLGLTILRALDDRPSPNARLLCDMLSTLDNEPSDHAPFTETHA
ncbi:hypothetical protein [Pseudodesulfovibrio portus]|uniref:Uncharacterized protein n=1 Tax=Pseudodesulfovibrio portus TaxID=231439 RepID=A0ABN6RXB2_9BACT|nr:hypothetical protein [Pseudodesulfovibrio portus]BDQ34207.1 hypothetical protein JCM14722_17490 [Pseudodesulfovibrio portus]